MQSLPLSLGSKPAPKKKTKVESAEFLRPKAIGEVVTKELKQTGESFFRELLGIKRGPKKMDPGVEYDVKQAQEMQQQQEEAAKKETAAARGAIDYAGEIIRAGQPQKENRESEQRVAMLVQELQRLSASVKAVEKAVVLQAIGPSGKVKSGKYYENFFEWMLLVVQDARRKVEDSGAWLQATGSKSKKRGIFKTMKTNMQVSLSGERAVSKSTG